MKKRTKKIVVSTKLSPDYYDKLHAYAGDKGISLYEALNELLVYALRMKDSETQTISALVESLKEDLKEAKKENEERNEELMKYLKRIYYHSYRGDASVIEFARRVQDSEFADKLHRAVENIVQGS
jgi:gas vesicle protein